MVLYIHIYKHQVIEQFYMKLDEIEDMLEIFLTKAKVTLVHNDFNK